LGGGRKEERQEEKAEAQRYGSTRQADGVPPRNPRQCGASSGARWPQHAATQVWSSSSFSRSTRLNFSERSLAFTRSLCDRRAAAREPRGLMDGGVVTPLRGVLASIDEDDAGALSLRGVASMDDDDAAASAPAPPPHSGAGGELGGAGGRACAAAVVDHSTASSTERTASSIARRVLAASASFELSNKSRPAFFCCEPFGEDAPAFFAIPTHRLWACNEGFEQPLAALPRWGTSRHRA